MDFTISGHVNRALVIVDTDDSTTGEVLNNTSSSTRVRWTGSSEMMDGNSVGIYVEYEEGGSYDGGGTGLKLRYANVHYAGEFGKVTIGQGSEAGDGSAYRGGVGTFGIGHGQEKGSAKLGGYFGSLDAGTRTHMIRYDTPAIGPIGAAVSVGNDDRVSAAVTLSTSFSGSSFNAMVATLREDGLEEGKAKETVGVSAGMSMANGLGISGAWARGDNHGGSKVAPATVAIGDGACPATVMAPDTCVPVDSLHAVVTQGSAAVATTDPSFFQAAIAYTFGDTKVAASWYNSEDFVAEGSEGTAYGVGVNHNLPKVGAQVYAAVQNYDVEKTSGAKSEDETVFVVGTRVSF